MSGYIVVYGITVEPESPVDLSIDAKAELSTISHNGLLAIIAPTDKARQRPSRANIREHQVILEHLLKQGLPVLPMRFGTVADSVEDFIANVLDSEAEQLRRFIGIVRNRYEASISVKWPEDALLDAVRRRDPSLIEDAALAVDVNAKINIGQRIEALSNEIHDELTATMLTFLNGSIVDHRLHERRSSTESVNAAVLVNYAEQAHFEAAIELFSRNYPDEVVFKMVSPLPPYSFVELTINLGGESE